ncbi:MAG: hypothetical protein J5598_02445, partial [Clostridia bacterium]|nr:hypothetical protein [Clostridia bacterium]
NGSNFEALIEFIRTYDGQLPSQHSKDVNERRLYYFYNDHKNDFNKEQKQRLNEVMVSKFDRIFEALIESIRNRDGQLPSQYSNDENEQRLYKFYMRNKNNFNEEQKQRLNEVMVSKFDSMFETLIEFIRTHDGQLSKSNSDDKNEQRLYDFYKRYRNNFNEEQKQRLNEVMVSKFDRMFEALIESIRNRDGQLPSQYSNNEKEQRLYDFYRRYRNNFNEEQKQRLNEVMVSYFDRMFETLIEFIKTHDGQLPKHSLQNENERKLYKFYIRNKNNFNKEQRQQLNEVMVSKFDRMFETLIEFIRTHDSHLPSAYSDDKNEQRLYSFYKRYRNTFNEKQNQLLITTGLPSKKLEKKTKCIITSQYCKCVLKQRQKDNLQNYHINNQTANNEKSI